MATLVLNVNVPDAQAPQILADFCAYHGWTAMLTDENGAQTANPETQQTFTKRMVLEFIRKSIASYRSQRDANVAQQAAIAAVNQITMS